MKGTENHQEQLYFRMVIESNSKSNEFRQFRQKLLKRTKHRQEVVYRLILCKETYECAVHFRLRRR